MKTYYDFMAMFCLPTMTAKNTNQFYDIMKTVGIVIPSKSCPLEQGIYNKIWESIAREGRSIDM